MVLQASLDAAIAGPFIAYANIVRENKQNLFVYYHSTVATQDKDLPQVKWARWQAKHALRAFFRRGLRGSLALDFVFAGL